MPPNSVSGDMWDQNDQKTANRDWVNEVAEWKVFVEQIQKHYYLSFHGSQFHDLKGFAKVFQINKILYAMYGPPRKAQKYRGGKVYSLQKSYSKEARENAKRIYQKIYEEFEKTRLKPEDAFKLSVTFVCYIHKEKKRRTFPVFSIPSTRGDQTTNEDRLFIDTNGDTHKSWTEWKKSTENLICCYPKFGFYTCSEDGSFNFDPSKVPILEFQKTPKNHEEQLIYFRGSYFGMDSFPLSGDFMNDPLLAGLCFSTFFSTTDKTTATNTEEPNRNLNQINKLLETLSDAESYLKALQEVPLSQGSRQMGFSKMQRLLAAVLIISKESSLRKHFFFLVNILVVFEKKTLLPHELMRFSANTLFFLNIHIEVGKAIKLFTDFNRKNIDHIAEKMTDEQTKQVFTEFLARNKDSSGYYSKRVIKAINYMDNPEEFFQQTSQLSLTVDLNDIDRSVIVKDLDGYTQKIDLANKRIQFTASTPKIPVTIKAKSTKLLTALGGTLEKHKYLSKLTNHDRARINYAIGGAANYKRDFIEAAETLANQLETKMSIGAGEFLSLVEIVAAEKRKDKDSGHVRNFLDAYVINQLVEGILSDLTTIDQIETELDVKFADRFLALYHYRKHGPEFRENCDLRFYLKELPNHFQTQGKVSSINQITAIYENGLKKILYQWTFLLKNDAMLAINYSNDGVTPPTISTIFKTPDVFKEYENRFLINEETYKALLIKLCQSMQGFNLDISSIPNPALKESMVSLIQNE